MSSAFFAIFSYTRMRAFETGTAGDRRLFTLACAGGLKDVLSATIYLGVP